eukprot:1715529-Pyramimonas_sp.AAC.1
MSCPQSMTLTAPRMQAESCQRPLSPASLPSHTAAAHSRIVCVPADGRPRTFSTLSVPLSSAGAGACLSPTSPPSIARRRC